eukprot:SAG31_NODE_3330_length_4398_cov_5.734589_10_plen_68_part_00
MAAEKAARARMGPISRPQLETAGMRPCQRTRCAARDVPVQFSRVRVLQWMYRMPYLHGTARAFSEGR